MEQFNDVFDIIDNNGDSLQYTADELNHYFESDRLNSRLTTDDLFNDPIFDELTHTLNMKDGDNDEIVLSQKLSQLSTKYDLNTTTSVANKRLLTTTETFTDLPMKKVKTVDTDTDTGDEAESVQDEELSYLSLDNDIFREMATNLVKSNGTLTMMDIRSVAVILHRMTMCRMKQDLYSIYLESLKGTLPGYSFNSAEVDTRVWPIQVQSMMLTEHKSFMDNLRNIQRGYQPIGESLLRRHIQEFDRQIELLQNELNYKRRSVAALDSKLEKIIQDFVDLNGLKPFKIKTDFKMAIVKREYEAEILQRLFSKENPNAYQILVTKRVLDAKRSLEKSRQALLEFKERVFYNKVSISSETYTAADEIAVIPYKRLDEVKAHIRQLEQDFYDHHIWFDDLVAGILKSNKQAIAPFAMTGKQMSLVLLRLKNVTHRWENIHQYRLNYYVRNAYDQLKKTTTMKQTSMNTSVLLSTLIIAKNSLLTDRQQQLLNRGPTYVPPCQMYVSTPIKSHDEIVKQQFSLMEYQLKQFFIRYHIQTTLGEQILKKIFEQFNEHFRQPIPDELQRRALYEKKLIESLRSVLTRNNLIVRRTADHKNRFYVGNRFEFESYVNEHLFNGDLYEAVSNDSIENKLNDMTQLIRRLLDGYNGQQFLSDINNVRISQAYFLPNMTKEDEHLQVIPFIPACQTVTWQLGLFLDQLLRPLVNQILESMVFHDELDFLNKLHHYIHQQQCFQSKTLFCTIKITNMQALTSHTSLITAVEQFLEQHLPSRKLQDIPISTIRTLLNLFLQNNFFAYNEKMYRFIKGSPPIMPLSETLSNIYLFTWQKHIYDFSQGKQELFGRYQDQVFLTLNNVNDKNIRHCLQTLKHDYPDVQFERLIGPCVIYMNTHIENRSGFLYTRIHHDSPSDRYTLPYVNGHAKSVHADWLRSALLRIICSCSNVNDFQDERINLELAYLIAGYSVSFLQNYLTHFFGHFSSMSMRYSWQQNSYDTFRQQCFTHLESKRIPLADINDSSRTIQFSYIYDYGSKCEFHRKFHELWTQYFHHHPILSNKTSSICLSPKDFRSLNDLLAQ